MAGLSKHKAESLEMGGFLTHAHYLDILPIANLATKRNSEQKNPSVMVRSRKFTRTIESCISGLPLRLVFSVYTKTENGEWVESMKSSFL